MAGTVAARLAGGDLPIKPRCHVPWQQMVIDSSGVVVPCCYWGAYGNDNAPMGNVNDSTIADIWNGERYQALRRRMAAGDLKAAGCERCHALKQGLPMDLVWDPDVDREAGRPEAEHTPHYRNLRTLRREVAAGAAVMQAKPTVVSMTPSHRCNIRCTHCYQESTRTLDLRRDRVTDELMNLCGTLVRLIAGGGEPFLLPTWRRFLEEFDHGRNPYLDFATSTNATVLPPEVEEGLGKFKSLTVNVSLDGTGTTYERVRAGAKFEEVLENVRKLLELVVRAPSPRSTLGASMCVMKSNILDLPNFVRLAVREKLPIGFSPVVTMPPDETLTCFNDPEHDTRGWREAIGEARRLIRDEFGPIVPTLHTPYPVENLLRNFDLVAEATPWHLVAGPHYRVRVDLPEEVVQSSAAAAGTNQGLFVYIFRQDIDWAGGALYYAKLEKGSAVQGSGTGPPETGATRSGPFHFEVSLPEGRYSIALSTKWQNTQCDPGLGFSIIARDGQGQVIGELWKARPLKRHGDRFLRRVGNALLRRLDSWRQPV